MHPLLRAGEENGGRRRAAVCRRGQLPWRSCLRRIHGDEESVPQGIRGLLLPIRPILPSGRNPVLRRSPPHRIGVCRASLSGIRGFGRHASGCLRRERRTARPQPFYCQLGQLRGRQKDSLYPEYATGAAEDQRQPLPQPRAVGSAAVRTEQRKRHRYAGVPRHDEGGRLEISTHQRH